VGAENPVRRLDTQIQFPAPTGEAIVAITVGVAAWSVLLTAFGFDSIIELISGSVRLWRLSVEARGGPGPWIVPALEATEQRARSPPPPRRRRVAELFSPRAPHGAPYGGPVEIDRLEIWLNQAENSKPLTDSNR
jgi:hypothetical protein